MHIDMEQLDMIADGYTEDFKEIYAEFCQDIPGLFSELEEAFAKNSAESAARTAHTIKGSVSNFGMLAVAESMKKIELQAKKEGNLEGLEGVIKQAKQEFEESVTEIKNLRNI